MQTLAWDDDKLQLKVIDQRRLPSELRYVALTTHQEVFEAIRNMTVRGAPAIGVVAAYGLVMSAMQSKTKTIPEIKEDLHKASELLESSRPTAVNLRWALQRMMGLTELDYKHSEELISVLQNEAKKITEEDEAANRQMAMHGSQLIQDGDTIIHHCNTGALATAAWGTALGVIRLAHEQGKRVHVLVDETRPRLQGSRLTAWELSQYGIPYEIITDNAAGYFLRTGQVDRVLFGGDRIASNGDVANKIGSYMLALAAHDNHVPVYSVVPTSTIDLNLESGDQIPIEERDQQEVLDIQIKHEPVTPKGAKARNPAFDVTPHRLITAIITERGVVHPPFIQNLAKIMQEV